MKTDLNYLKTMSGNSSELISEMIDIFRNQVDEFSLELQKLYDSQNYEGLGKLAHKAKTSVAIMGMDSLSNQLKILEKSALSGKNPETYQEIINYFKSECKEALKELTDFQNQLS